MTAEEKLETLKEACIDWGYNDTGNRRTWLCRICDAEGRGEIVEHYADCAVKAVDA